MSKRLLALGVFISCLALARAIGSCSFLALRSRADSTTLRGLALNAEARIARAIPLAFEDATLYELTLIPSMSDTLAQRLLDRKAQILATSQTLPAQTRWKAFEAAHGIGPARARYIAEYVSLPPHGPEVNSSLARALEGDTEIAHSGIN